MRTHCIACVAGLLLSSVFGLTGAQAVTYNLDIDHCTGGCSNGFTPFGTVTVLQDGADLDFTVTLNSTYVFQKSTGLNAFTFGFSGDPAITITNLSAGFSVDASATVGQNGFGTFFTGIDKAATGGQSLSFTVLNQVIANLVASTNPPGDTSVLFSADISSLIGEVTRTGAVGGSTIRPPEENPPEVPLPGAVWLFGTVLAGGAGYSRWRKRWKAALAV